MPRPATPPRPLCLATLVLLLLSTFAVRLALAADSAQHLDVRVGQLVSEAKAAEDSSVQDPECKHEAVVAHWRARRTELEREMRESDARRLADFERKLLHKDELLDLPDDDTARRNREETLRHAEKYSKRDREMILNQISERLEAADRRPSLVCRLFSGLEASTQSLLRMKEDTWRNYFKFVDKAIAQGTK